MCLNAAKTLTIHPVALDGLPTVLLCHIWSYSTHFVGLWCWRIDRQTDRWLIATVRAVDIWWLVDWQTTDENWQLAVIKEAAAVIFKVISWINESLVNLFLHVFAYTCTCVWHRGKCNRSAWQGDFLVLWTVLAVTHSRWLDVAAGISCWPMFIWNLMILCAFLPSHSVYF